MTAFSLDIVSNDRPDGSASIRPWSNFPPLELGGSGWVFGHLFRRGLPSGRVTELSADEQHLVIETAGQHLLRHYWGGYVAAITQADGTIHILRDPSGSMPCYVKQSGPQVRLASDLGALVEPGSATVDFGAIVAILASVDRRGRRTGIVGVEELLPGFCFVLSGTASRIVQAWSPFDHIRPRKGRSLADAADEVRATVKDSVGAWASSFDAILLGVSGGLDSSIVAVAAIARTPGLHCYTMAEPGTNGDERQYVNALSAKLGLRITTCLYDLDAVDVEYPVLPNMPLPIAVHFAQAIEAAHRSLLEASPVDAYFSGNGGDNVFCSLRSAVPLVDRFLAEGPRPGLIATLRNIADLTGADMMSVVKHGWDRFRRRRAGHRIVFDISGLTGSAAEAAMNDEDLHPWLTAPVGTLPGKAAHVALLARAQMGTELYPRREAPPHIAPLLSQPIVELCLSIPTWYWVAGGQNRAVARSAFENLLPELLIGRTSKGSPSGFLARVYAAQAARLADFLRGGRLVDEGIITPDFIERTVRESWHDDGGTMRLLSFAAAEAWIRWWESGESASSV